MGVTHVAQFLLAEFGHQEYFGSAKRNGWHESCFAWLATTVLAEQYLSQDA